MRFNYVKYDHLATVQQEKAKEVVEQLEELIVLGKKETRAQQNALNKLEECYMWIGKMIRDEQIKRNSQTEHVPERTTN